MISTFYAAYPDRTHQCSCHRHAAARLQPLPCCHRAQQTVPARCSTVGQGNERTPGRFLPNRVGWEPPWRRARRSAVARQRVLDLVTACAAAIIVAFAAGCSSSSPTVDPTRLRYAAGTMTLTSQVTARF